MAVMAWILMTTAQAEAGSLLDTEEVILGPREIDNPLANNLGAGTLVGKWVSPARLLNDHNYLPWVPTLGTYPIHTWDSDVMFLPVEE